MATLPAVDAALFIRLHTALLVYVNRKLGLVPRVDSTRRWIFNRADAVGAWATG